MAKKATLSKNVNRDVVLCSTPNRITSNRASKILLEKSVPFSKCLKRVPFFKRHNYRGASEIYVISINRTQYSRARRVLYELEDKDYSNLILNVI